LVVAISCSTQLPAFSQPNSAGKGRPTMGNTPSTPEGKDSHRLSKQKSSYSLSSGLESPQPLRGNGPRPSSAIRGLPTDAEAVVESQSGDRRSRPDLRQRIRSQLQADDYSSSYPAEHGEYFNRNSDLRPSPSRERLSQSLTPQSSFSNLPYAYTSQSPPAVDPRSVDLQTAVGILEELRKTASPEDLVALRTFLCLQGDIVSIANLINVQTRPYFLRDQQNPFLPQTRLLLRRLSSVDALLQCRVLQQEKYPMLRK
jgi:hypothetical protein